MRFQKTTEYAIRVMAYLAKNNQDRFSVNALHQQLQIPYKYLSRLMHTLANAGLVEVAHGKQGGYQVVRDLSTIYLYQIVGVVEGLDDYQRCVLGFPECSNDNPCTLHRIWLERQESIREMIYNTTLADLNGGVHLKY